jgi:hypothetical protein
LLPPNKDVLQIKGLLKTSLYRRYAIVRLCSLQQSGTVFCGLQFVRAKFVKVKNAGQGANPFCEVWGLTSSSIAQD